MEISRGQLSGVIVDDLHSWGAEYWGSLSGISRRAGKFKEFSSSIGVTLGQHEKALGKQPWQISSLRIGDCAVGNADIFGEFDGNRKERQDFSWSCIVVIGSDPYRMVGTPSRVVPARVIIGISHGQISSCEPIAQSGPPEYKWEFERN